LTTANPIRLQGGYLINSNVEQTMRTAPREATWFSTPIRDFQSSLSRIRLGSKGDREPSSIHSPKESEMHSEDFQETDDVESTACLDQTDEPAEVQIWQALLEAAQRTASTEDSEPLVLNSFATIRKKAADLLQSIKLISCDCPPDLRSNANDLERAAYETRMLSFREKLKAIAIQLYALNVEGMRLAKENDQLAEDFWRSADYPAEGWDSLGWSLAAQLKEYGMAIPSVDEDGR
jgi:hypothetical protein